MRPRVASHNPLPCVCVPHWRPPRAALSPPRYLLPCSHVMLSQKRAVRDLDIYGKTAAKFLSLIPRCCRPESLPPPDREEEHAAWSKGTVLESPRPIQPAAAGVAVPHGCHPILAPC